MAVSWGWEGYPTHAGWNHLQSASVVVPAWPRDEHRVFELSPGEPQSAQQARTVKRHTLTVRELNALDEILEPSWADRGTIRGPSGGHLGLRCLLTPGGRILSLLFYTCVKGYQG